MAIEVKQISNLEQISKISAQSNVLIEENGRAKRFNANNLGKVKSVNGIWPDENGNIEIGTSGGGGGDIPTALPNPEVLTFTGAVQAVYDGSKAVTVEIPQGGTTGASVNADWTQNDPESPDYIVGRTHYVKDVEDTGILAFTVEAPSFRQNYQTNKYYYYMSTSIPNLIIGAMYTVTINENQYQIIAKRKDELGNASLESNNAENTGEDFYFEGKYLYLNINVGDSTPTSLNVSVIQSYAEVVPIDAKFLTNKPGMIVTGLDFEFEEEIWTADDGAEIFNNPINIATGEYSHAEGDETKALDWADHAEGYYTVARGGPSHAEGDSCEAHGYASHVEGCETFAYGQGDHAEGYCTVTGSEEDDNGTYGGHAEGYYTKAIGEYGVHVEGNYSEVHTKYGEGAHAEGSFCYAFGDASHAEGEATSTYGSGSHSEGYDTLSYGEQSHTEGEGNYQYFSITGQGKVFTANKELNVQPGDILVSNFKFSEVLDYDPDTLTITTYYNMTDEAVESQEASLYYGGLAGGDHSHVEGYYSKASGLGSHVQGSNTVAPQAYMDVIGKFNKIEYNYIISQEAKAMFNNLYFIYSHTFNSNKGIFEIVSDSGYDYTYQQNAIVGDFYVGKNDLIEVNGKQYAKRIQKLISKTSLEFVFETYTTGSDREGKYAHIVGNGTSITERSNAHTLDWNGTPWYQNRPQFGGTAQDEGSQTVVANGDTEIILTSPGGIKVRITVNDDGTMNSEIVQ